MNPDLIRAFGEVAWPIIAVVLLWRLYPLLRSVAQSRAFTVKVAGMEISVQQASEQLQAQIDDLQTKVAELRTTLEHRGPDAPATAAERKPAPEPTPEQGGRVLWVDDNPPNNALAIAQLRSHGYEIIQALTTSEAMRFLGSGMSIAAVLSDMGREEAGTYHPDAGLELLTAMRSTGFDQPVLVVTSGANARRYANDVVANSGSGATNSYVEILEFIRKHAEAA